MKIKPYVPLPYRNKVVKKYDKPFVDAVGNEAIITYVDKKKVLIEGYVMYIEWK